MDMLIGGIAGAGATMFSNPMDVVKTRLQLQGELRSFEEHRRTAHYRNVFHAMYVVARTDGPLALQQGLAPAMLLGFVLNSVGFSIYHMAEANGWTKDDNGEVCLYKSSFWSSLAGALGGMVSNPIYIVKTRIQAVSHPSIAVGRQHIYNDVRRLRRMLIMDLLIGGLSGAGATIFSNPMDVVKTRLQLQGELRSHEDNKKSAHYRNVFHSAYVIARTDGPLALQKGLVSAMVLGFVLNSIRLGIYHAAEDNSWTKNNKGSICLYRATFWSGLAGAVGGGISNPIYIVKTRIQAASHPSIAVGRQHVYNGTMDAVSTIYKTEGIKGFFAGLNTTCVRMAMGSSAQLTTFSTAKQALLKRGICKDSPIRLAFFASLISGVVVSVISCPLDVVAIRLYNQGSTNQLYSTSIFDTIIKIYRIEGLHGLYKGIVPLYMRVAPHTTVTLVIWDALYGLFYPVTKKL